MRRVPLALLLLVLAALFAACGGSDDDASGDSSTTASATTGETTQASGEALSEADYAAKLSSIQQTAMTELQGFATQIQSSGGDMSTLAGGLEQLSENAGSVATQLKALVPPESLAAAHTQITAAWEQISTHAKAAATAAANNDTAGLMTALGQFAQIQTTLSQAMSGLSGQ